MPILTSLGATFCLSSVIVVLYSFFPFNSYFQGKQVVIFSVIENCIFRFLKILPRSAPKQFQFLLVFLFLVSTILWFLRSFQRETSMLLVRILRHAVLYNTVSVYILTGEPASNLFNIFCSFINFY